MEPGRADEAGQVNFDEQDPFDPPRRITEEDSKNDESGYYNDPEGEGYYDQDEEDYANGIDSKSIMILSYKMSA